MRRECRKEHPVCHRKHRRKHEEESHLVKQKKPCLPQKSELPQFSPTGTMEDFTIIFVLSMMASFAMMLASFVGGPPLRPKHTLQTVVFMTRVRVRAYDIPVIHVMYNVAGLNYAFALLLCKHFPKYTVLMTRLYQVQVAITTMMHVYYAFMFVVFHMSERNVVSYLVSWLILVWQDTWCDDLVVHLNHVHNV